MSRRVVIATIVVIAVIGVGAFIFTRGSSEDNQPPEEAKIPTIGLLGPRDLALLNLGPELAKLGYIEGETIQYQIALGDDHEAAFQSLIDAEVDVIVATGTPDTLIVSAQTTTIPIVFMIDQGQYVTDIKPIIDQQGVNTNLTGVIITNPAQRRFQLMMEIVPSIKVVYVPYNPSRPLSLETLALLEESAQEYGVRLETFEFSDDAGGQRALDEMPDDVDAVVLGLEVPTLARMPQWVNLSLNRQIPLVVALGQFVDEIVTPGVLMGYGGSVEEIFKQVTDLIDQILHGAQPSELPIRPTDDSLTVNLGAAEALGIEVPDSVLYQATYILRDKVALPTAESTSEAGAESGTACNATLHSPLGENSICITSGCDQVEDGGFVTFTDKVEVESCSAENLLGICSTASGDSYFYSGEVASIESGCTATGGEWSVVANP